MNVTSQRPTIAVFGGTFDPPHAGHLAIARAARGRGVDGVLFVPGARPPHKEDRNITPFHHRMAMLRVALRNEPGAEISDVERRLASHGPTYTCLMMEALRSAHPEWTLLLLIGEDSLRQLHTWRDAGDLARRWPILTFPRNDGANTPLRKELEKRWPDSLVETLLAGVIDAPSVTVSSTKIRKKLAKGENVDNVIDPGVAEYAAIHRLYACADADSAPQ